MDPRKFMILGIMDVLLLVELVLGIWAGAQEMSTVASTFCMVFLPPAVLTVMGARWALKRFASPIDWDDFKPVGITGPLHDSGQRIIPRP
jgi:hypothetical protein